MQPAIQLSEDAGSMPMRKWKSLQEPCEFAFTNPPHANACGDDRSIAEQALPKSNQQPGCSRNPFADPPLNPPLQIPPSTPGCTSSLYTLRWH